MFRRLPVVLLTLTLLAQDRHPITGRNYAHVMGAAGADWLTRPERETEEQPDRALDLIGIPKAATFADIGAGNGYMTWRVAERTGPRGKVYAVDIQAAMLDLLRRNIREHHLENV